MRKIESRTNLRFGIFERSSGYQHIEVLLQMQPRHVPGHQAMADRALRAGQKETARAHLDEILKVAEQGSEAQWARKMLQRLDGEQP